MVATMVEPWSNCGLVWFTMVVGLTIKKWRQRWRPLSSLCCRIRCFLANKFGKEQVKLLKSALVDFYSDEELISAKQQLLKDIDKVNVGISFPHIPKQRQGDNRAPPVALVI